MTPTLSSSVQKTKETALNFAKLIMEPLCQLLFLQSKDCTQNNDGRRPSSILDTIRPLSWNLTTMIAHESTDISAKSSKGKGMVVCQEKASFLLLALPASKRMDVFT